MNKEILKDGVKLKIIGDSIAAGAGSSNSYKTDEIIFSENGRDFFKRVAPNSWWGLLEEYLKNKYSKCTLKNKGCGGAFSYQINKYLDNLVDDEDELVFVLMGLNDRKRKDGMDELKKNCEEIIDRLVNKGLKVVLLTPNPSVHENEYYENRLYHTDEVVRILNEIAEKKGIELVDNYKYINEYLEENNLKIDDIIYCEDGISDGLHPGDKVQKLIFENIIKTLRI